ncbi:Glutamate dehydrogenase (NAD(P)(+)) [Nitrosococcus halophilus Nc 4]|uniref:Glutamate dehydrogenase n=1 Tax=Nitrosococcus halophilus (strain Nc4) TaxID=472759 RepID=D5BVC3_NITHN|nr:Glu/Leu/Phe/Val dehydrogenase [Nitrosococcus halophilus]ADE13551.1 Glutamate dehydrogenase (NAD(P)(+)) [Nitrosococcus halophilus Nc 4]
MENVFKFADELGPLKVIHVYEPSIDLKGILVIDNVATGPSIGGVRLAPDVSTKECFRLARAMTLKNAAAELPHGGGKAVLFGDPKMPKSDKERLIRAFACSLREAEQYIFAPDMGTDEESMAWVKDEIGRVVGLPRELGGIPLDEIGATGWGISHVVDVALRFCDFELAGARIVVQGFGAVGYHAARFLTDKGAVLVGAADSHGTIHRPGGLNVETLSTLKQQGKSVVDYPEGERLERESIIDIPCDIWIPAARPDVIREDNVQRLKTKLVIEGANIPATLEAEKYLHAHGVLCVPDFIANAGGVICAAMEYQGANESLVFQAIEEKLRRNTEAVLKEAKNQQKLPREAAVDLASRRVRKTMGLRRWSLF